MTSRDDKIMKALAVRPEDRPYEVGYQKTPEHTRYKPKQSGNPGGRPKGSKNKPPKLNELQSLVLKEAYREIKINEGDRSITASIIAAVVRRISLEALKGKYRQQQLFTDLVTKAEREQAREYMEMLDTYMGYKVEWERELERRKRLGITGPEPAIHPDQIVIDFRNNTLDLYGPTTKAEKAALEKNIEDERQSGREMKELFELKLAGFEQELAAETDSTQRKLIERDIEWAKGCIKSVDEATERIIRLMTSWGSPEVDGFLEQMSKDR